MRRLSTFSVAASLAVLGTSACNDFLSSNKVKVDPNNPSSATADQLFVTVQAAQFAQQEGIVALIGCLWLQQCTGTSNFLQTLEKYDIASEDTPSAAFSSIYEGGGLVDIRQIEAAETAAGDLQYLGIAQMWEVLDMAVAADIYGDVPYREAAGSAATPHLDPQAQVYSDLQALLDQAITNLSGAGPGPLSGHDLVYNGNTSKWIDAAHTLKARLFMHTAETATGFDNTALNNAVTNALLGIKAGNDLKSKHTSQPGEDNLWFQFYDRSGFGQYVVAGQHLADLMNLRNDPRRAEYFGPAVPGPGFGGQGPPPGNTTSPAGVSSLTGTRNSPTFSQPIVTYIENQLILAEAYFRLDGNALRAQAPFDAARASVPGLAPKVITWINDIMEEKYVAMYQNIEVWNDYKRSCYPAITAIQPPTAPATFGGKVPGRLYYGTTEQNANPNVPDRSVQNQDGGNIVTTPPANAGFRNPNDPNPCP